MNIAFIFIVIGVVGLILSRGLKTMFVDSSDENNPYRMLAATIGYGGIAAIFWGVILLTFYGG